MDNTVEKLTLDEMTQLCSTVFGVDYDQLRLDDKASQLKKELLNAKFMLTNKHNDAMEVLNHKSCLTGNKLQLCAGNLIMVDELAHEVVSDIGLIKDKLCGNTASEVGRMTQLLEEAIRIIKAYDKAFTDLHHWLQYEIGHKFRMWRLKTEFGVDVPDEEFK